MRLLLSAFAPELGPLAVDTPPGWEVATVGVGAVSAAAATSALVLDRWPEAVVFLGTCGRYDQRLPLFECLWATEAIATSLETLRRQDLTPWVTGPASGVRVAAMDGGWRIETGEGLQAFTPLRKTP